MAFNKIQKASLNPDLLLIPLSIVIPVPGDGTYDLDLNASYPYRIIQVDAVNASGTISVRLTINGIAVLFDDTVGGTESLATVSSTPKTRVADSLNDVDPGDNLKLVLLSNSSSQNLAIKVHTQRI